MDQGNKVTTTQ